MTAIRRIYIKWRLLSRKPAVLFSAHTGTRCMRRGSFTARANLFGETQSARKVVLQVAQHKCWITIYYIPLDADGHLDVHVRFFFHWIYIAVA